MTTFIYKPKTYKGPVLLVPDSGPKTPPTITLPNGQTVQGKYLNTNEGRHQFVLPDSMIGMQGIQVSYGGSTSTIGNGAMSYEGSGLNNWQERFKGSMADPTAGGGGGMMGMGGMGMYGMPNPFMMNFNPVNFQPIKYKNIDYKGIDYKGIEAAPYQFTDPLAAAGRYNDFNTKAEGEAYETAKVRGQELTDLDTQATMNFAQNMSGLQQNLVDSENKFNQAQRLQAVDFAMPDLRSSLDAKRGRAETYASGRLLSSAEDRAYEVAARSASADGSFARGFGDDSVFGKRTSDVLSAQQRLGISQMGEGLLNDWISQGSSLLIDSPLKTSISQRLPSVPSILPSQQSAQQQSNLTNLTTVPLQFGISSEINQQQFSTNLEQGTRTYNASNEFSKDQFNASNVFAKDQFNAGNTLAKDQYNSSGQLGADQFNSSGQFQAQQAQFGGLQTNYQLATQASNRAEDIQRQDLHNQAASAAANQNIGAQQTAGNAGATAQIGGGIVGAISTLAPLVTAGINAYNNPSTADTSGVAGAGMTGSPEVSSVGANLPTTSGYTLGGAPATYTPSTSSPVTGGQSLDATMGNSGPSFSPPPESFSMDGGGGDSGGGGLSLRSASIGGGGGSSSGGGDGRDRRNASGGQTASGAPTRYNGAAIPVGQGSYDGNATAQDISQGMQAAGAFISTVGQSGPSTPQITSLGQGIQNGATAAETITQSFQSAATPEARKQLADQLHGVAVGNAPDPESKETADRIFSQVKEHLDTGVGVNGQAAGIAGFIQNYDSYNGPERARAITNIAFAGQDLQGQYGVKDLTGHTLGKLTVPGTNNKLTLQDAMSLSNSGYNVSSLVTNWDDITEVHGTLNGNDDVLSLASTARSLGLLDSDTPETINQKQLALRQAGANPAGAWGAGAVAVPDANAKSVESLGMVVVGKTSDGQSVAIPIASAASAGLSTGVVGSGIDPAGLRQMAPSTLAIGQGAAQVYNNWPTDFIPKQQASMGGQPAVANGLYNLGAKDPYMFGKVTLGSLEKGQVSAEPVQRSIVAQNNGELTGSQKVDLAIQGTQVATNMAAKLGSSDAAEALPYVNAAASGKRLYDVFSNPNSTDKQKAEAVAGAMQSGTAVAAQLGSETAGEAVPYLNYAMAAYNTSKILGSNMSDEDKAKALRKTGENTVAAYMTLGLSSAVQYADQAFFGGKGDKLRDKISKYTPGAVIGDKVTAAALGQMGGKKEKNQMQRDQLRTGGQQLGLLDPEYNMTLASGKTFNVGVDGKGGEREWHDPSKRRPDQTGVDKLRAYDIDYTRDLDAVMNVGGVSLATLMYGSGDDENVRKMGNYFTNGIVSDAGTADLTREGFSTAQANLQLSYKKAGIESKAEAYALSNQMLQEGRISQTQLVTVQQGINLAFDQNGFQAANQLLEGVKLGRRGDDIKNSKGAGVSAGAAAQPTSETTPKPATGKQTMFDKIVHPEGKSPPKIKGSDIFRSAEISTTNAAELTNPMEIQDGS